MPFAGMTVWGYSGLFSQRSFMSVVTDTTNNENVLAQKKGNHKGCPYGGFWSGLFSEG